MSRATSGWLRITGILFLHLGYGSPVAQVSAAVVPRPAAVGRPVTPGHTACFQQLHHPGHPKNLTLRVTLGVGGPYCELPFDL